MVNFISYKISYLNIYVDDGRLSESSNNNKLSEILTNHLWRGRAHWEYDQHECRKKQSLVLSKDYENRICTFRFVGP